MGATANERWHQAQEIVEAALELEAAERSAYLESEVGDDPTLRDEVVSLIEAHEHVHRFLETPALRAWTRWCRHDADAAIVGQSIGPYRILRQIGQGGMAAVFLAARADDEYRKEVAIKLVDPRVSSDDVLRRFRSERQILATLDHPNVARLHDGGTSNAGSPYLVMEYVEGTAIDEYCDEHRLPVAERLELFRSVCSAVRYAHQRLVVHRDLKPRNILVTADGVPKLLDFGIAKILDPASSPEATGTGLRPLTLNYASPEQILGGDITLATDVYSLGVVLYRLLTGRLPHRFSSPALEEIKRQLLEEPARPSRAVLTAGPAGSPSPEQVSRRRRTSPQQLRRHLSGDLDNVVMMALRTEPERRYASVEQLIEDLDRYAAGLPIRARQATPLYRAGKLLRRHRFLGAAIAAFLTLVVGFVIATVRHAGEVSRERDQVVAERENTEQVAAFLIDLLQGADPLETLRSDPTVLEILDAEAGDLLERFAGQPVVRARLLDVMGTIYQNRGRFDRARPLLEKGLELRRQALGPQHPDVAVSLTHLGDLVNTMGEYEAAAASHREALAIRRRALGDDHPQIAQSLHKLGLVAHTMGDFTEAESRFREALELRRELFGDDHPETAETLGQLALELWEQGRYDEAEPLYLEALAVLRRQLGNEHPEVALVLNNLGALRHDQGDLAGAEALHREALEMRRRIFGPGHPIVGQSLNNLATALRDQGKLERAETLFREVLAITRKFFGEEHHHVAVAATNVANVLLEKGELEKGELEEAETLLRDSVAMLRRALPATHPHPAFPLVRLGRLLMRRGEAVAAEPFLREAVERRRQSLPAGHPLTAVAESELDACLAALGRYGETETVSPGD